MDAAERMQWRDDELWVDGPSSGCSSGVSSLDSPRDRSSHPHLAAPRRRQAPNGPRPTPAESFKSESTAWYGASRSEKSGAKQASALARLVKAGVGLGQAGAAENCRTLMSSFRSASAWGDGDRLAATQGRGLAASPRPPADGGEFPNIVGIPLLPIADGISRTELAEMAQFEAAIAMRDSGRASEGSPPRARGIADSSAQKALVARVASASNGEFPSLWVLGTVEAVQEERRRRAAGLPPLHPRERPRLPTPPPAVEPPEAPGPAPVPRCAGRWKPPSVPGPAALEEGGPCPGAAPSARRPSAAPAHGLGPAWRRRLISIAD